MSDTETLVLEIEGLEQQAERMERLASATERVADALERLNGEPHGGIRFIATGDFMKLTVEPAP